MVARPVGMEGRGQKGNAEGKDNKHHPTFSSATPLAVYFHYYMMNLFYTEMKLDEHQDPFRLDSHC